MMQQTIKTNRVLLIGCLIFTAASIGCNKPKTGPKREDHEAAHKARYHPDVNRNETGTAKTNYTTTQPNQLVRPADLSLASNPVACPVLFVNGETISTKEVLEPIIEDLQAKAATMQGPTYLKYLGDIIDNTIRNQISTLLIYQEAKKEYTSEQITEAIDKEADRWIKQEINRRFNGIHARYEEHLKSLNLAVADMKERAKRQVMVMQFQRDRFEKMLIDPSRRERMKFYNANLDKFTTPAKAELFLIEVPIASELDKPLNIASSAEIDAARKRAQEDIEQASQELKNGGEFEVVVKKYSKGIYAAKGGSWGEISPGALTNRWAKPAEVLFTLEQNQVSNVIETEQSLFIVKCGNKTIEKTLTFEQAQEKILNQIRDDQFLKMQNDYLHQLLVKADIRRYTEFFRSVVADAPRPTSMR